MVLNRGRRGTSWAEIKWKINMNSGAGTEVIKGDTI